MLVFLGDLGQTYDSQATLDHYVSNPKGQAMLFIGDLSYADDHPHHDNERWDTWGRFVEKSTAYQPWIWTAGNHEIDFVPEIVRISQLARKCLLCLFLLLMILTYYLTRVKLSHSSHLRTGIILLIRQLRVHHLFGTRLSADLLTL